MSRGGGLAGGNFSLNEADTCRLWVVPRLQNAGWDNDPHAIAEQRTITDGRIVPVGESFLRRRALRVDYLLCYRRDYPLAVVEAKASYRSAQDGVQQARDYALRLGLPFAYATNGHEIVEIDLTTGTELVVDAFPTPARLWQRHQAAAPQIDPEAQERLLVPDERTSGKEARYYQHVAIQRALEALLAGDRRVLLTLATGTGKTFVAFQICWKLWSSRWNLRGRAQRPRILYLADRNFLVDDPMAKEFAPFGDARHKIGGGAIPQGREMYFALYQSLAEDESRAGLYRTLPADFFDLIVVDECHRGSARDDSNWREILEWFEPAAQLGMTATPLRQDNRDTYQYFGNPVFQYSLRQGIEDGFLAPYRVHRVVTDWDAAGWRPSEGDLDRYGRTIPDREYQTPDFERRVALEQRTQAIARHLTDFLRRTDRFAKTFVFCVDQEHALSMRQALVNLNADLVAQHPDYVCRVTADEGELGRRHWSDFQDLERRTPVILTTSLLLTTGVDAPTAKNVALVRSVGSMTEFKQILGRGTRVRDDYGKLWFNVLDYTGSATLHFADPEFDGDPVRITAESIDDDGAVTTSTVQELAPLEPGDEPSWADQPYPTGSDADAPPWEVHEPPGSARSGDAEPRQKLYFDGGTVEIAAHLVYELDADGHQLRVERYTVYAGNQVRTLYPSMTELRRRWADPAGRAEVLDELAQRGIAFEPLAREAGEPEADPFDLLCHLAFQTPVRSRRERAQRLREERREFFARYRSEARAVLNELLEKYTEHGTTQFDFPEVLKVPPLSRHGNVREIAELFGGPDALHAAVNELQTLLYAA
jgi:type I restriction enzyme, R subunit